MQGTKSLPSTPKEQNVLGQPPQFWSLGPKDQLEHLTRPPGVRVKLFEEESADTNTRKSVHWGSDSKPPDKETESGSPVKYWNVDNGVIENVSDASDRGLLKSDSADFDMRVAQNVASQGSTIQATLLGVSRNHNMASGIDPVSENHHIPGIMTETSGPHPAEVSSQTTIQHRLLRDGHFTSSPKQDKSKSEVSRDSSQDISLVSSISAPFELRPKAYDDSVISEEATFVDESEGEKEQLDMDMLHDGDNNGAIQLINNGSEPFASVAEPVGLPSSAATALPTPGDHLISRSQSIEEGQPRKRSNEQSDEDPTTSLHPRGHGIDYQPLEDDDSILNTGSVNNKPSGHPMERPQLPKQTNSHSHSGSRWVDNAVPHLRTKGAIPGHGESKNVAIQNLEQVRSHLHNMMNMTKEALPDKAAFDQTEDGIGSLLDGLVDVKQDESFSSAASFPVLGGKCLSDLETILNIGGGMPSVGSYQSGSSNDSALFSEIQFTKEQLQRERFRRKHCEKQITELQSKMLELQQQLAVAVSTDRKKETMIEHLDKALAKVVDGWKKKDNEKLEIIQKLDIENRDFRQKCEQQHQELLQFTAELKDTRERLNLEINRANKSDQHITMLMNQQVKEREESKKILETEHMQISELEMQRNELQEAKDKLLVSLTDLQQTYENDKENWEDKERDYLQKIDEITDNHLKGMDQERCKLEKQTELLNDTQQVLTAAQTAVQNLKIQLDTTTREKESLKVEMGLTEARLENSKRKLESDLRSELERQMTERIEEAHNRQMSSEEELRERHRRQMFELNQRHSAEMEEQLQQYQEDVRRKEEKNTHLTLNFEEKVTEMKVEMDSIKSYVKKLESQRLEMTNKLQSMMQTHCNEALRLLQIGSSTTSNTVRKQDNGVHGLSANEAVPQFEINSSMTPHPVFQENNNVMRSSVPEVRPADPSQTFSRKNISGSGAFSNLQTVVQSDATRLHRGVQDRQFQTQSSNVQSIDTRSIHPKEHFWGVRTCNTERNNVTGPNEHSERRVDSNRIPQHQVMPSQFHYQLASQNHPQNRSDAATVEHLQRNPSFLETLAAEAESQAEKRLLITDYEKSVTLDENFKPLSNDTTINTSGAESVSFQSMYADGQNLSFSRNEHNRDSIDMRLSTGTLVDEENNNSNFITKSENASEGSQNSNESVNYKQLEESVNSHEERQSELQHYIKKLLQRSPNSPDHQQEVPTNTPADTDHPRNDLRVAESGEDRIMRVFSPVSTPVTPPKLAFHKSLVGPGEFTDQSEDNRGVLSPQQVGEISRLLGLYRPGPEGSSNITSAGTTPPMAELLTYLKDLNPVAQDFNNPQELPTKDVTSTQPAKRNFTSTYNTFTDKEAAKDSDNSSSTSKGSPSTNRTKSRDRSTKPTSKLSNGPTKQPPSKVHPKAGSTAGGAAKKPEGKVVSSKAKHGVWK